MGNCCSSKSANHDRPPVTMNPINQVGSKGDQFIPCSIDPGCTIAIDFGTSRSAFAFAFIGAESGNIYHGVPDNSVMNVGTDLKAETSIVLNEYYQAIGFGLKGRKEKYLENELTGEKKKRYLFQWFKMLLKDIPSDSDTSIMATDHTGHNVPLLKVISEALVVLSEAALDKVNRVSDKKFSKHEILWVVTIPAIWSPAATGFMRKAAKEANIIEFELSKNLTLVREPEGACLDLLNNVEKREMNLQLHVGMEIVVLDCGGGTNDMTFISIQSMNPLKFKELKIASGGTAGAAQIDRQLLKLLEELFGSSRFEKMKVLPSMLELLDGWESFKISFAGEQTFIVRLSNWLDEHETLFESDRVSDKILDQLVNDYNKAHPSEEIERQGRIIKFSPKLISKWFDEVINNIISDLRVNLEDIACRNISLVYLVGGFTANAYCYDRMVAFVNNAYSRRGIKVIRALHPDLAIVKGAVLSNIRTGFSAYTEDHIAAYCYGIEASVLFRPGVHEKSKSYVRPDGKKAVDILVVYAVKGQRMALNYETNPQNFVPISPSQECIEFILYTIDDPAITSSSIVYISDPKLKKHSVLKVKLNKQRPFKERRTKISLKFGMETQIVAKDVDDEIVRDVEYTRYNV